MPRILEQDDIESLMSEINSGLVPDGDTASDHDSDNIDQSKIIRYRKKGYSRNSVSYRSPIIKAHQIVLNPPSDTDHSVDGRVIVRTIAEYSRLIRRRRQPDAPPSVQLL